MIQGGIEVGEDGRLEAGRTPYRLRLKPRHLARSKGLDRVGTRASRAPFRFAMIGRQLPNANFVYQQR
ncbi:hypothetical protein CKO40_03965 [Halochromatium glycolicum]|uniref:Uncharacterized protein n=1 Tax=Halochromatium glycolicum TaxID=85075 RepID=A0AAJ0U1U9_9GAMM|nr:hypothetical protein [Halochromatium glycolicum]